MSNNYLAVQMIVILIVIQWMKANWNYKCNYILHLFYAYKFITIYYSVGELIIGLEYGLLTGNYFNK